MEDVIKLNIDFNSVFYPNSKIFKHFKWPCNVGDDLYDAYLAITGEAGSEDSRFGVPECMF